MVTAQIATIPDRAALLKITVESLLPQVDQLNVMLNGHELVPSFLKHPKITYHFMDNSKGDAVKFYGLKEVKGYVFTCDDDLKYPEDYVQTMISKLQQYNDQVILTNHGRIMNPKPVSNSYTDRKAAFHCLNDVDEEVYLDIGGTGVMAWHADYFFPNIDKIDKANMGDIWIAKFAHEQGCKILLNPHKTEWIQYLHPQHTIWDVHFPDPQEQTDLYNSF
jgi:hypothetical protein